MIEKGKFARPGGVIFGAAFVVFALFLLSQLGAETKYSSKGVLFAQPRFWPGVGVGGMVLFGSAHLWASWRDRRGGEIAEAVIWMRALEYLLWFMVYVAVVPVIGYLGATVIFMGALVVRQGYRGLRKIGAAVLVGVVIVLIFKAGLAVQIPGGAVYEYLPAALRNFMIVNF